MPDRQSPDVVGAPVRVLVVEDDRDHAELIKRSLARHRPPFDVTVVGDGHACLDALTAGAYTLVLLDYTLPGMDGVEVLERIRELRPSVPVVLVTAQADERVVVRAMKAGGLDYVLKTSGYLAALPTTLYKVLKQHELFQENARLQEQLVQAQKMEAVGQLAGGVAHDFNNLLTVIGGRSAFVLQRKGLDASIRRDVELISKAAERAGALTRQLLAFSRKQVLRPKPLDLNAIIGGLAPMLRRLIGEHIELVTVPGSGLGHVLADPGQLEQVIMNLVVNARDAMPEGGTVRIEPESRDLEDGALHAQGEVPPGQYVAMRVQDSGCGIDSTTLTRIFEPFFTTKDPGKGTGLGLSTVHGIVRQSGGYIGVDSTVGRGTTFTIYLPRAAAPIESPDDETGSAPLAGGKETILLVEDDEQLRQLASEALKTWGYKVLDTGDPIEALAIAERRRGQIHLLLSDMVMPALRGPALAAHLLPLHPEMRVLYMSGYADEMIASRGAIEPPGDFLPKPFTPEALARAVRYALDAASPESNRSGGGLAPIGLPASPARRYT